MTVFLQVRFVDTPATNVVYGLLGGNPKNASNNN